MMTLWEQLLDGREYMLAGGAHEQVEEMNSKI